MCDGSVCRCTLAAMAEKRFPEWAKVLILLAVLGAGYAGYRAIQWMDDDLNRGHGPRHSNLANSPRNVKS